MERRRLFRLLRMSTTVTCLAVTTVIAVAWVRNFWIADVVWAPLPGAGQVVIASSHGQMEFGISYPGTGWAAPANRHADLWGWETYTASPNHVYDVVVPWKTVIRYRFTRNGDVAALLPHWLLAVAPLLLAAVPWIRWSRRFTIRTLLLITTLVAVVLAMAVTAGE